MLPPPTTTASQSQMAANRANAALSTGPRTPQGKAASSRNAVSHGIFSANLVIFAWESQDEFDGLRNAYIERHRPIDRCELDQVDRLVDSIWRRNRLLSIETAIMDLQLSGNEEEVTARFPEDTGDAFLRMALAFEKKHAEKTPDAIQRYITSVDRAFSRARRELEILQGERFNQMPPSSPQPTASQPDEIATPSSRQPDSAAGSIEMTERTQSEIAPQAPAATTSEAAVPETARTTSPELETGPSDDPNDGSPTTTHENR